MYRFFKISLFAVFSILLSTSIVFSAEDVPTIGFQAEAQLPENQLNKEVSYFHVGVNPNDQMTLHVQVSNPTEKEVTVIPAIHRAKTNSVGVVEYTNNSEKSETQGQANIEEVATIKEKEINLNPKETYDLEIHVSVPKEFKGIQAGAIRLLQKDSGEQTGNVRNQFAREIGLILESISSEAISSSLTLNKVNAGQVNARNTFLLSIENNQPKFTSLTKLKGVIKEKGSDKTIAEASIKEAKLAPDNVFEFPVSLNGKEFKEGKYIAIFSAKEDKKKWNLEKEFTVTTKESEKLNESDVLIKHNSSFIEKYARVIILIILFLLVIGSLFILKKIDGN